MLSWLPLYELNSFSHFLKWVRELADLICGKISQHYFMFTETAVSMQWLEVEQCAFWTRGDTDAYIYFYWQWTQDNDLGKKIEQRKWMLCCRAGSFHFQLHAHTHTQWSHEWADWVTFLSWSFAHMRNSTSWSPAGLTRWTAATKEIQTSE